MIGENNARRSSISAAVVEIANELKDFVRIRYRMFRAEIKENLGAWKKVAALGSLTLAVLGTAYLLFTIALVAVIAGAFYPSPYAWFFGFIITAVVWSVTGVILALLTRQEMKAEGLWPKRTVETLKEDKVWIQQEIENKPYGYIEHPEDRGSRAA